MKFALQEHKCIHRKLNSIAMYGKTSKTIEEARKSAKEDEY